MDGASFLFTIDVALTNIYKYAPEIDLGVLGFVLFTISTSPSIVGRLMPPHLVSDYA